jgi:hypothetical protein
LSFSRREKASQISGSSRIGRRIEDSAVVYLRIVTKDSYTTSFVASKSRVAPIAAMSIPRLELVATLIVARLVTNVKEPLSLKFSVFWT